MRLCIVTPSKIGFTETFIRAHVEGLPHDVLELHGTGLDYTWRGRPLSAWHADNFARGGRWLNLLPRFLEFRLRRRLYRPADALRIACDFLMSMKVDVVLAEYGTTAAYITPVCRAAGVPLVAHFHGFDASRHQVLEEFADSYRLLFDDASAVISVSKAMTTVLENLGCPKYKIVENPCGPDPSFFKLSPDYASQTLIAVGRHTGKKAPYLTLDAFRRALEHCPNLRLCMIGDGELFEVSERLVEAWGLGKKVNLVGAAAPDVIKKHMSTAFAFLQHSIQARDGDSEGMPVAILEAGAAGLPVISTRHAGIPDVVTDGECGFVVEPGDSQAMANCIVSLDRDRELARKMGEAIRSRVKEGYSLERHLNTLDQCLVEAARNHSHRNSPKWQA